MANLQTRGGSMFASAVFWVLVLVSTLYIFRLTMQTTNLESELDASREMFDKMNIEISALRNNINKGHIIGHPAAAVATTTELFLPPLPPIPPPPPLHILPVVASNTNDAIQWKKPPSSLNSQERKKQRKPTLSPAKVVAPKTIRSAPSPPSSLGAAAAAASTTTSSSPNTFKKTPERKCAYSEVRARMAEVGAGFSLLDPKVFVVVNTEKEGRCVTETEMHACACQVKCRESSCSAAVDLCHKLSSSSSSSSTSTSSSSSSSQCSAVVLADGNIWATLKRGPTPSETRFLKLREASTMSEAEEMVAALVDVHPKRGPFVPRSKGGGSAAVAIKDTGLGSAAEAIKALLLRNSSNQSGLGGGVLHPRDEDESLCHGGPVQGPFGQPFRTTTSSGYSSSSTDAWSKFLHSTVGVAALSMNTPASLAASMASWKASGLLELVGNERVAMLSEPSLAEEALAKHFEFKVVQPKDLIAQGKVKQERAAGPNRLTIGSAFFHALNSTSLANSDYVLFLEKDFAVADDLMMIDQELEPHAGAPTTKSNAALAEELVSAAWLLEQGAFIVRLRARQDMGCSGFRTCVNGANRPEWGGKNTRARRRNWLSFYCEDRGGSPQKIRLGTVADCIGPPPPPRDPYSKKQDGSFRSGGPHFRCFSSWDSNWSLNAVMVHRRAMLEQILRDPAPPTKRAGAKAQPSSSSSANWKFGTIARYGESKFDDQAGFERGMLDDDWGRLKVPICLSMNGVFKHHEVDN